MAIHIESPGFWIARHAELLPDRVAIVEDDHRLTYQDLARRIEQLAGGLAAHGIGQGDRVALLTYNHLEVIELLFACARLGATLVPLNFRLATDELTFLLEDAGATALIYEDAVGNDPAPLIHRLQGPRLAVRLEGAVSGAVGYDGLIEVGRLEAPEIQYEAAADDVLVMMYTAGSTGLPKGVMLSHGNLFWQCQNALMMGLQPDVVCLAVLPFFHVGGLFASAAPVLMIGGRLVIQSRFDATLALRTITAEQVNGLVGVPAIFQFMAQAPAFEHTAFPEGSVYTSGGAPLPVPLIEIYARRGVTFRQGYGLTEASAGVTGMAPEDALPKAGSVGKPCFYTDVRVLDDRGEPVPAGSQGEIAVRGPNVMLGYWNRPEDTEKTLRTGWLLTGDIGRFDGDGYLYITDRKKDMIISGGENIFPAEIEKILFGHPKVRECSVIGAPDPQWGEKVVAVVVSVPGVVISLDDVRDYLTDQLARYKLPRELVLMDELPRSAAGKVLKHVLKEELGLTGDGGLGRGA